MTTTATTTTASPNSVCPLCSSEVFQFHLHFHCDLLMCSNTECPYPFDSHSINKFLIPVERAKKRSKLREGGSESISTLPQRTHVSTSSSNSSFSAPPEPSSAISSLNEEQLSSIASLLEEPSLSSSSSSSSSSLLMVQTEEGFLEGLSMVGIDELLAAGIEEGTETDFGAL